MKFLVEHNSNPLLLNSEKLTPLHLAAKNMHLDVFDYLFDKVKTDHLLKEVHFTFCDQSTPLHLACQHGNLSNIQYLMSLNYSIEAKDCNGCTPLHYASQHGQLKTLKYLLQHIFDTVEVDYLQAYHYQTLSLSIKKTYNEVIVSNYVDKNDNTPLHTACIHGKINIVHFLVFQIGLNPNSLDKDHLNCLHLACIHGHFDIVELLVTDAKCDVNCIDLYGRSPVYFACEKGYLDIFKYLRGKGANPLTKTTKLWTRWNASYFPVLTLVHIACLEGHEEMMRYLIEDCGIDPMSKDEQGVTPLYLACHNGHTDIAKYLIIEQHCDPHFRLNDERTCLHAASGGGNLDTIKYLITKCNCNASTQDEDRHVPSYYDTECSFGFGVSNIRLLTVEFFISVH